MKKIILFLSIALCCTVVFMVSSAEAGMTKCPRHSVAIAENPGAFVFRGELVSEKGDYLNWFDHWFGRSGRAHFTFKIDKTYSQENMGESVKVRGREGAFKRGDKYIVFAVKQKKGFGSDKSKLFVSYKCPHSINLSKKKRASMRIGFSSAIISLILGLEQNLANRSPHPEEAMLQSVEEYRTEFSESILAWLSFSKEKAKLLKKYGREEESAQLYREIEEAEQSRKLGKL